jgi:LuxR family transcriptional regulator, maltose regulon positive regulatory protein
MNGVPSLEGTTMNTPPAATRLLATKLHLPAPRATAVTRPRLVARLLAGLRARLALVAAPAGFGKSTLLAQALAEARATPPLRRFAWVALDQGDNDPARFWTYAFTALERASPGAGAPSLAMLQTTPAAIEPALAELLNGLAEQHEEVVLLLDDYHAVTNPAIHEEIGFLLEHAPPQFHLVIASRVDPPLPLARWRVRGELAELRAADLRFTPDEALQFFAETMGLRLDAEAAAALEARTEGWAAGLQLAALSLQGQEDIRGFIESFSGSHRHVVDYLVEEVLQRQPDHIRAFLLQTSVLDRLSGSLCDAVLGVAKAEASGDSFSRIVLDTLERDNLFLIPLDNERRWYRYHHLFADLLRHRLRHERPTVVSELHRRAALWYEQQDMAADAVSHAFAAADMDLVVRLLTAYGPRIAATGETLTLQRWLDALPRELLVRNPRLCVVQAQVLLLDRRAVAVESYLDAAERALAEMDDADAAAVRGELLAQRAHVAIERGAFAEAHRLALQALELLPASAEWARSSTGLLQGYALMVLGKTSEAVAVHAENVGRSRAAGHAVAALFSGTEIVKMRVLQGRLGDAHAAAEEALAWAAAEGWQQLAATSALHIWLGNVLLEQGNFAGAELPLGAAIRLSQHGPAITAARAHTFLARLRQLQGYHAGAEAALATVEAICRHWEPGGERTFFEAYTARVRLLGGDTAAARRWAAAQPAWDRTTPPSYFREIELLTLARIAVLDDLAPPDDPERAETHELLAWLRDHASAAGRNAVVIETLALEGIVLARRGEPDQAHGRLDAALALAAPEGFFGIFLDLGAPMAELLARNLGRRAPADPARPYLTDLLSLFRDREGAGAPLTLPEAPTGRAVRGAEPAGAEALTERELEVLRLYAAGMTSAEIAEHFVVSINTVKTQLKSIYSKLDAHSRAEAVASARKLQLIP